MSDVVIIGGGIVGCACAYELTKHGASVTLLEYGKTGMQATNAAAGMLAPMIEADIPGPMFRFGMRALGEYSAIVAELEERGGFAVEYRPDGILKVAFDDGQAQVMQARLSWQHQLGIPLHWLDGDGCHQAEPRLSDHVVAGLFSPTEGSVSNQLLALAFERAALAHGATIRQREPFVGFTTAGGLVTGVRTPSGVVPCDAVVIAAGARSGQIAARLKGAVLPVRPIRGQMLALGGMSTPIRHIVWGPDGYLVPRANGLVFAGATVEDVGFRRRTTQSGLRSIRRMADRLVPQLAAAKQHFDWAGLRPGTPDDLPIIGPLPPFANAVAATGHYRNGILLGPLTGKLVAQGIVDGDWSGVPDEFAPSRFA